MTPGQSLSGGAAGTALLHIEHARTDPAAWSTVAATLTRAVADGVTTAPVASLYYGAPALSFVLHTADGLPGIDQATATVDAGTATVTRHRLDTAHRRIDRHQQPLLAEYDLIGGLTGIGVALRRSSSTDLLADVLTYLVRLTEPIGGLPGWWCPSGPNRTGPGPPGGHSNQGAAHGITGPLALLAVTLIDGIHVPGHVDAITRITGWLDTWEQHTDDGDPWWPEIITLDDLHAGRLSQTGPLRPSWCYGTPGIARAQQLAARALGDTARQHHVETAFITCVTDPRQVDRLIDRGLCHGTAGLLATGRRIAADALTPIPLTPLLHRHQGHAAPDAEPPGLLEGSSGAALATAGTLTSWDACLLLV
ncbi:lanthionine synthetase [Actinomadura craniellae]|uniref:Lanthionine synthetase n=1 Tax=Actinomadura craniellae TaxID=2231787 RepID=A0A365HD24_9ACTN|nr:lanthionine synthetase C family protein [Actinomadura craniellae]RAY17015.1 lanthionine synthetase [Actinomadura craniellae]